MADEIWRDIDGYEGLYQVSNFGRVRRMNKTKPSRIIKPELSKRGYLRLALWKDNKPKKFSVHRIVAGVFILNPNNKPYVNHIDGNPQNNHVNNLEWCTPAENNRHAVDLGLINSGEDNYLALFTNKQVEYIRNNPKQLTQQQLAEEFGTFQSVIGRIQRGESYKNADGAIRQSKPRVARVAEDARQQIRDEYIRGTTSSGIVALAKKYNLGKTTIHRIIHEK